jgi:hypothetical protein
MKIEREKKEKRVHPADLPENRHKHCPDYLKAPWASEQSRLFAKLLDERQFEGK